MIPKAIQTLRAYYFKKQQQEQRAREEQYRQTLQMQRQNMFSQHARQQGRCHVRGCRPARRVGVMSEACSFLFVFLLLRDPVLPIQQCLAIVCVVLYDLRVPVRRTPIFVSGSVTLCRVV